MELVSIETATNTAVTSVLDLSMTVKDGDNEVPGLPFTYDPSDTAPMAEQVKAYLADHPNLTIGDYVAPTIDYATIDQTALNAALVEPGSVVRALGLVTFAEINKLRVKNGDTAYTMAQFKAALLAQMRG